jgi:hypothetical protein
VERDDLIKDLACPLEWSKVCPEPELALWLNFAWYAIAYELEVDQEVRGLISYDDFSPSAYELKTLDAGEVKSALINARSWQGKAQKAYEKIYRGLHRQRALRRDEFDKHYPRTALTPEEVVAESRKRGEAVLRPALDVAVQARLMWAALSDVVWKLVGCNPLEAHRDPKRPAAALTHLFHRHVLLVAATFGRPVGASGGQETDHLLFNLDLLTGHFHCYPILEKEYEGEDFKAYVQGWNYALSS